MTAVLVVFESKYGQTSKIAERIGQLVRSRGHLVRVSHVEDAEGIEVASFEGVIVLAPVYFAKHPHDILAFARGHVATFAKQRSAFFSVSNSAASDDPVVRDGARRLALDTLATLGWHPDVVATTGGALAYPRYNFLLRFVMRRIARRSGEPTDVRRVHERTSWGDVEREVDRFLEPLEERRPLDASPERAAPDAVAAPAPLRPRLEATPADADMAAQPA